MRGVMFVSGLTTFDSDSRVPDKLFSVFSIMHMESGFSLQWLIAIVGGDVTFFSCVKSSGILSNTTGNNAQKCNTMLSTRLQGGII